MDVQEFDEYIAWYRDEVVRLSRMRQCHDFVRARRSCARMLAERPVRVVSVPLWMFRLDTPGWEVHDRLALVTYVRQALRVMGDVDQYSGDDALRMWTLIGKPVILSADGLEVSALPHVPWADDVFDEESVLAEDEVVEQRRLLARRHEGRVLAALQDAIRQGGADGAPTTVVECDGPLFDVHGPDALRVRRIFSVMLHSLRGSADGRHVLPLHEQSGTMLPARWLRMRRLEIDGNGVTVAWRS